MNLDFLDEEPAVERGALVVVNLHSPREKMWGVVLRMDAMGLTIRGIDLSSFDDWVSEIARGAENMMMGLSTLFIPMHRVEKIVMDQTSGAAHSCSESFEHRTKMSVIDYLRQNLGA